MSTALGIVVVVVAVFAALGVSESYRAARGRDTTDRPAVTGGALEWDPVADIGEAHYLQAWDALGGRAVRLQLLAIASDEMSVRCRGAALAGRQPPRALTAEDYCYALPVELGDAAGRPGDRARWQSLDRALARMSAVADLPDATAHADAHEQIAIAARDLADGLGELGVTEDLDHCWFCGRGVDVVERLLCSTHAAICGDCAETAHARLGEL